jgi:hypothetical protein
MKMRWAVAVAALSWAPGAFAAKPAAESERTDASEDSLSQKRARFEADMRKRLAQLERELSGLKKRAAKLTAEGRKELSEKIAQLESEHQDLSKELSKLKESGQSAWEKLRAGFEGAVDELGKRVDNLFSKEEEPEVHRL